MLVGEPLIAIPAAVVSHFICDALPHYGRVGPDSKTIGTKGFVQYLLSDATLCMLLVAILAVLQPQNWGLAALCAFLAAAPDFGWINKFRKARSGKPWRPSLYSRFARDIQWFQRPIGWPVEIAWAIAAIIVISPFLRYP